MFVNRGPKGSLDPAMPKNTDIEKHRNIEFGLYIHSGDWRKDAWQKATERNFLLKSRIVPRETVKPSYKEDRIRDNPSFFVRKSRTIFDTMRDN